MWRCLNIAGISPLSEAVIIPCTSGLDSMLRMKPYTRKRGVSAALAKTCSTLAEDVYTRAEAARKAAATERREQETPQEQTSL